VYCVLVMAALAGLWRTNHPASMTKDAKLLKLPHC
jgi:hypothetical protein